MIPRSRLIAIFLYLFYLSELLAFGPTLPWNSSIKADEKALRAGKKKQAKAHFLKARTGASQVSKTDLHFAKVLDRIGMGKVAPVRTDRVKSMMTSWLRRSETTLKAGRFKRAMEFAKASMDEETRSSMQDYAPATNILIGRIESARGNIAASDSAFRKAYDAYLNSDGANSPGVVFTDVTWCKAIAKSRDAKAIDRIMTPIILAESKLPPVKKVIGLWLSLAQIMSFNDPKKQFNSNNGIKYPIFFIFVFFFMHLFRNLLIRILFC